MTTIREIMDYELLEAKVLNRYSQIWGEEYGRGQKIFELSIDDKVHFGLISCFGTEPQIADFHDTIVVSINDKLYFIDKYSCEVLKVFGFGTDIYEYRIIGNKILVVSDLDIACIDSDLETIWKQSFKDVLQDYKFTDEKIVCEVENSTSIIDIYSGKIF